jgi:hypothetical protein
MKGFWVILIQMALPMLRAAGVQKKAEDGNDTGKDDAIGVSLIYAADLLESLVTNQPLPKAPDALK